MWIKPESAADIGFSHQVRKVKKTACTIFCRFMKQSCEVLTNWNVEKSSNYKLNSYKFDHIFKKNETNFFIPAFTSILSHYFINYK